MSHAKKAQRQKLQPEHPSQCDYCKGYLPLPTKGEISAGYTRLSAKEGPDLIACYECTAKNIELPSMVDTGTSAFAALYYDAANPRSVMNWSGTLAFPILRVRQHRKRRLSSGISLWFVGPDGFEWVGTSYGDSQLVRARRTRIKVAGERVPSSFLRPASRPCLTEAPNEPVSVTDRVEVLAGTMYPLLLSEKQAKRSRT